jgi:glyoxylase-like metal-dependent hydrolase (beta-lactamase superfamily II)
MCYISVVILSLFCCTNSGELELIHQVTGPIQTNCYLLYDTKSKEAALFDVGGPIDSLITMIHNKGLKVKYVFATHCHMDHIEGVPEITKLFPEAKLCYNRDDYRDFLVFREWMIKNWDPDLVAGMKEDPALGKWFTYDLSTFRKPDIYLEDNQIYNLGSHRIRTTLSPGHSRGSICFYTNGLMFSGDVLFYKRVGRTDLLGGSKEDIIKSVQRLYMELPDETQVYPGHGQFTNIGFEKNENEEITINEVNLQD